VALVAFRGDTNVTLTNAALAVAHTFYRYDDTTQSEWARS